MDVYYRENRRGRQSFRPSDEFDAYGATKYAGDLYLCPDTRPSTMLGWLHEMAHALQFNVLGVTRDYYSTRTIDVEAQAWAIALQWVNPKWYKRMRYQALRCLHTYMVWSGESLEYTRYVLNDHCKRIQYAWEKWERQHVTNGSYANQVSV